jgi:hypothetical protein
LLDPLGMEHSTFDRTVIRTAADRAIGHASPHPKPPLDVPMTAAGGLYTSAADLARFLTFQLNDGSIDGQKVLDPGWLAEMRTVQGPRADEAAGWGLGVPVTRWNRWPQRPDLLNHGGGGFGFRSEMWWAPEVGIGIAILTNSEGHHLFDDYFLVSILGDLVAESERYQDRLAALPVRPGAVDRNTSFEPPDNMARLIASAAMQPTGDESTRWADRVGAYGAPKWGITAPYVAARFLVEGGAPYFEAEEEGALERHRLIEVEPGIFLADNGETLDLAGPTRSWRGVRLVRVAGGPAPWQWGVLVAGGLLAATWLLGAVARTIGRFRSRASSPRPTSCWRLVASATAAITALLVLANISLVVASPGLVDSGFLGWLRLPLIERLGLHLPLTLAIAAAGTAVAVTTGVLRRWWSEAEMLQYAGLSGGAIALAAQLSVWGLIGWGFG